MARSSAAIQADLDAANTAIGAILAGTRVESMSMGSKSFAFAKMTVGELRQLKSDLQDELDEVNGTNSSIILTRFVGGF